MDNIWIRSWITSKKSFTTTAVVLSFLLEILVAPTIVGVRMGYSRHHDPEWGPGFGHRGNWNYCPYCGRSFRGERRYSYGIGAGMMELYYRYDDLLER